MSRSTKPIEDFLPLTPAVFHILLALQGGPRHGYAIMKAVEEQSDSGLRMGPGTIYGSLQRMEESGLVREADPDPPRRIFEATELGHRVLRSEALRLQRLTRLLRSKDLLSDEGG